MQGLHYNIDTAILKFRTAFPGLLPFGHAANDFFGPTGDDDSASPVTLTVQLTFIGREYSQIIVRF